jgi:hypothetical protein
MKTKIFKVEIPEGYEIDKENSTFENIVFKKVNTFIIKWNQELFGVEIKDNENHFVISAQPSMVMDWDDAVKYYKDNKVWQLPTREQLQLVAKYINKIDALIKVYGGYEIFGWFWAIDEDNESRAWSVSMYNGHIDLDLKNLNNYVRGVSNL